MHRVCKRMTHLTYLRKTEIVSGPNPTCIKFTLKTVFCKGGLPAFEIRDSIRPVFQPDLLTNYKLTGIIWVFSSKFAKFHPPRYPWFQISHHCPANNCLRCPQGTHLNKINSNLWHKSIVLYKTPDSNTFSRRAMMRSKLSISIMAALFLVVLLFGSDAYRLWSAGQ